MRFQIVSLRTASRQIERPLTLHPLTEIEEYRCFLYRCEGEVPLHRHLEHDELFWPLDGPLHLLDERGQRTVEAGQLLRVPRGWKHGSSARAPVHVLLLSRAERVHSLNGHLGTLAPAPPSLADPVSALAHAGDNVPCPLLRCDTLQVYAERVAGTGHCRRAARDVLVAPLGRSVGVRCGGIVAVAQEREVVRVPAGSGWHLFGEGPVLWMTVE